jgi:hypothetical protein
VRVFDPASGAEVPSQVISIERDTARLLILADVLSVGFKIYDVQSSATPSQMNSSLRVTDDRLRAIATW